MQPSDGIHTPPRRRRLAAIVLGGLAVAGILVLIVLWTRKGAGSDVTALTACAERGPLTVRVIESGEVEAERREVISNQLHWPVYIAELLPDGTQVKKDELIVRFECKELLDAIAVQRVIVDSAGSDFTQAAETVKMKEKENDFLVYKAEQDVIDAKDALRRYEEGDYPTQLDKADSDIRLAEEDLTLAKGKLEFKKTANADPELNKPYSDSEIKADELALQRLELAHKKAVLDRDVLAKYDNPQKLRQLKLGIRVAELMFDKAQVTSKTDMLVAKANLDARSATLKTQSDKLKDLLEDEQKLTVKASRDGLVVYNTGNRWSNQVVVEVGARLDPRQQIMIIPDMTSLRIKTRVYEAMIDQVANGNEAFIRLDAKPDVTLVGKVDKVAPLPDSQNYMNPTAKVYNVFVKLDATEGLKPNMTAQCELILARLDNVLTVPVAAVFAEQEQRYCYRSNDGKCQRIPITTGRLSETRVEVLSGLREGDVVWLNPPNEMVQQDKPEKDKPPRTQPAQPLQPALPPAADRKEVARP